MIVSWSESSWNEYLYWQVTDKNILKKINSIIKDIIRSPFSGIGKPEPLKYKNGNFWARRINEEHRLVYTLDNDVLYIAQCRWHYNK